MNPLPPPTPPPSAPETAPFPFEYQNLKIYKLFQKNYFFFVTLSKFEEKKECEGKCKPNVKGTSTPILIAFMIQRYVEFYPCRSA